MNMGCLKLICQISAGTTHTFMHAAYFLKLVSGYQNKLIIAVTAFNI